MVRQARGTTPLYPRTIHPKPTTKKGVLGRRILREGVELPEGLSEEERRNREGTWRYDGVALERSIEKVAGELRERADDNGAPGLVGFSQGANLAAMVASNMQEVNGEADRSPRFIMCFCGVNFSWSSSNAFSATGERRLFDLSSPPDLPALLIVGQEDLQRRNEERFISLFGFDEASQSPARTRSPSGWPVLLVRHSEGHTPLPEDLAERERLLDAVQGFLDEVENLRSGRDVPD